MVDLSKISSVANFKRGKDTSLNPVLLENDYQIKPEEIAQYQSLKDVLVERLEAKSTRLDDILKNLLDINDLIASFANQVFQQEIKITESEFKSRKHFI